MNLLFLSLIVFLSNFHRSYFFGYFWLFFIIKSSHWVVHVCFFLFSPVPFDHFLIFHIFFLFNHKFFPIVLFLLANSIYQFFLLGWINWLSVSTKKKTDLNISTIIYSGMNKKIFNIKMCMIFIIIFIASLVFSCYWNNWFIHCFNVWFSF